MPDVLVLARDDQSGFEIEALAAQAGLRSKVAYSVASAIDWLNVRDFQALVIDAGFPIVEQQKVVAVLWNKDLLAPCLAYRFDENSSAQFDEVKLYGAEVFASQARLSDRLNALANRAPSSATLNDRFEVLVVEDLDSPRDIICMYIESMGFSQVTGVQSAQEAVKLLLSEPERFSCIVSDMRMPEMSGKELVYFVRSNQKLAHLPIVMLTAYGTVDCLVDCLKAGASGFLVKPPRKKELRQELSRARRIAAHSLNPRLASPEEAERMRNVLIDKGLLPP